MIHLAIRGYVDGAIVFNESVDIELSALDELVPGLASRHAAALSSHPLHMIEIEFLDELDPEQRFFRFGTDPAGMVLPVRTLLRRHA